MPIQLPYIQPLSFEQNNPFFSGMKQGGEIGAQQLANALQKIKLQYAPREEAAAANLAELQPDYLKAETGLVNANTGKVPSEIAQNYGSASAANSKALLDKIYANIYKENPALLSTGAGNELAGARLEDAKAAALSGNRPPPSQYSPSAPMQALGNQLAQGQPPGQQVGSNVPQGQPSLVDILKQKQISEANKNNAFAQYGGGGGRYMSTLGKDEIGLIGAISRANPQIANDPIKLQEAADAARQGKTMLSDGTPVQQTGEVEDYLNKLAHNQISAKDYNTQAATIQAEAENKFLTEKTQQWRGDLGDTYLNKPIDVLLNEIKGTPEADEKIGKLIAMNAIQNDRAAVGLRLVGANQSVSGMKDFIDQSMQRVPIPGLKITGKQRDIAAKYLSEATSTAGELRLKAKASYNDVVKRMHGGAQNGESPKTRIWNASKGDFD